MGDGASRRSRGARKEGGGRGHPPVVVLQHRRDVVALEALPRLAQIAGRHERRVRAVELQRGQDVLDLNDVFCAPPSIGSSRTILPMRRCC